MLYCITKEIVRGGVREILDTYYSNEKAAMKKYEETAEIRNDEFSIMQTLYEVDTGDYGFDELCKIPFECYKPIATYSSTAPA